MHNYAVLALLTCSSVAEAGPKGLTSLSSHVVIPRRPMTVIGASLRGGSSGHFGQPTPDVNSVHETPEAPTLPSPTLPAALDAPLQVFPTPVPTPAAQVANLNPLDMLVEESARLFFSEHGRCGQANRKSTR